MESLGKELLIPVGIVAMIASMLVPLPPGVIDFLLVINLICALVLLTSSLYISEPLKLSSLPSIILLTALYRLSLNVSTTRMILGSGSVSNTIEAFGKVVVQGNIVLGLVIFLVITLVQFIVIAKGSERVAEVSARFTLDSLPGKQMSIDADVRSGLIDFSSARKKRQELQIESRFYGALDGAMKFIKGDAVAGLVITAVNLVGGIVVGAFQEGLPISMAIEKYTLLTVGDGLLAQIPALLNSLAAGMVVTRVGRGDDASLAKEIPEQLGQLRRVKLIIGVASLLLAFVPSMPVFPFAGLAVFLILSAIQQKHLEASTQIKDKVYFSPKTPSLVKVTIGKNLILKIGHEKLLEQIDSMRQGIFDEFGLILPVIEITSTDRDGFYDIEVRGIRAISGVVEQQQNDFNFIVNELKVVLSTRLPELVDDSLSRRLLDITERNWPELAGNVVPDVISITQLSALVRALLFEGIPVKNFDLILQAVAEAAGKISGERQLLEEVRIALRRIISFQLSSSREAAVYALDPVIDIMFSKSEREGTLISSDVASMLCHALESLPAEIIISSKSARALVRDTLRTHGLKHMIVAYEEIVDDIDLRIMGTISLTDDKESVFLDRLAA